MYHFIIIAILFASACLANAETVRRAAFDIGSGTTKVKVADVNTQLQQIEPPIFHSNLKVDYQDDLSGSTDSKFSEDVMTKGISALKTLKAQAEENGATHFSAVATAAFRKAKNAISFIARIKKETQIPVTIIDPEQEAILGFYAGQAMTDAKPEHLIVWDIGGGSQQLTIYDKENRFQTFHSTLASVGFKNHIIKQIQSSEKSTPNPILPEEVEKALETSNTEAKKVPDKIRKRLLSPNAVVLGIGAVHYYSLLGQIHWDGIYTRDELRKTLKARAGLSDEQIGGKYASTEISNMILVLGFMEELGIDEIQTLNVNMADGILINPSYWE